MSKEPLALREVHRHTCGENGELRDCEADEDDPHEAGVCDAWDALRDAYAAGAAAERARVVARLHKIAADYFDSVDDYDRGVWWAWTSEADVIERGDHVSAAGAVDGPQETP